jgi:hypothetical protein
MISTERIILVALVIFFGMNAAFANDLLKTSSAGRAPAKNLKMKTSKVPTFEIHTAKGKIPRLDIGEEKSVEFSDLRAPASEPLPAANVKPIEKRAKLAPVVLDSKKAKVDLPGAPKVIVNSKDPGPVGDLKELKTIADPETVATAVEPRKYKELTSSESKLLEAQILLETHKAPETALGLLVEILDDKSVQTEARYTYALAARQLGLHSEFRSILMKIAQESKNSDWGKVATEALAREVEALNISDMKVLSGLVEKYQVDTTQNDAYNFYRAKYFLESGDLGQVEDALKYISEKSKFRADALLISALSSYRSGKIDRAEGELKTLLNEIPKDNSLRSIGALTLARIYFQKNKYKDAYDTYLQVDRQSALWMQAVVEQAWAQILTEDFEGAAGNMFSLHTDFFKNAFSPESYTVRSVAYLNLCQFGDGMQVLDNLKKKYGPLVGRLIKYRSEKKSPQDYYDTVRNWMKNSDLKEMHGLPRSFIVELARHPSFMNVQQQINNFEDELEAFNKANLALIQREKDLIRLQAETKEDQAKYRDMKGKTTEADFKLRTESLERQVASLKMQYDLAKKSRGLIKDARLRAAARIDKEKVTLKEKASGALKVRLETLVSDLTNVLEQNEVLQYEILVGAGEHLRAQSAGADTTAKDRTALKPADGKSVKWSFKGEIWEDEVGHYRSSLKNVCTKDDKEKIAAH